LTRLPVPHLAGFEPDWLTRSAAYFPLAGLIVGAICGIVLSTASEIWGPAVAAVLAVAAGCAATGCFHEDGLADTADGLGGGQTAEQRLLIM
ncbi:adenosylcobinamide-GDP ribazoletransferase, partial [Acinetobacter baumannii]